MNVKELIEKLEKIKDKKLEVRIDNRFGNENLWLDVIQVFYTGSSGYELFGEVVLKGFENEME
tara:strand:- start:1614 stop:1802 length:189 start_codon:yes stop_codon:yes gene_type:complete